MFLRLAGLLTCVLLFSGVVKAQDYQYNNVIRVKLKEVVGNNLKQQSFSRSSSDAVRTGITSIDQLNERCGAIQFKRVFSDGGKFAERRRKFGLHLWYEITFDPDKAPQVEKLISDYSSDLSLSFVEPVYAKQFDRIQGDNFGAVRKEVSSAILEPGLAFTPADPRYNEQWHYNNTGQTGGTVDADIDLSEAWDIQTGNSGVIVSVHDGGIDYAHEDLTDNMWVNSAELSGSAGVDDDGNGYVDDIYGYNFVVGSGNVFPDPDGHGTHVAGTVAAVNDNGIGVSGVAGGGNGFPGIELMSCQVFTSGSGGFAESYAYAADNGAIISQNSWGYTSPGFFEQSVLDAIDYFIANAGYDAVGNPVGPMQGGIVIFAAGNSNSNSDYYPGFYDPILAVASTNHNDQKAWYSNYGTWVDISAPGGETSILNQGVLSTLPSNTYGFFQGTSMACPHVSGVAALIVSEFGGIGFTPDQVRFRLTETTDDIDPLNPAYVGQLGTGRMNAFSSLLNDDGIAPEPIVDLSYQDLFHNGVTLTWTAPEDADNTKASSYNIRFSESLIDASNFETADVVANGVLASSAGEPEVYTFDGLTGSTTYYFAVKSKDFFGNESDISNVISLTTPAPPIANVTPTFLEADLFTGETETQQVTISNSGEGNLDVSLAFTSSSVSTSSAYSVNPQTVYVSNETGEGLDGMVNINSTTLVLADLTDVTIGITDLINYTIISGELANRGASVKSISFPLSAADLEDVQVLLVDDVIVNASLSEIEIIRDWITAGGNLTISADNSASMSNVNSLLTDTGINETSLGSFLDGTFTAFEAHPITDEVSSLIALAYGSYCTVSGDASAIVYDDQSLVHAAVSNLGAGKVLAVGNEFASDFVAPASDDNLIFALQAIDWLASRADWVSIPLKSAVIPSGQSVDFDVVFDAVGLTGGLYEGSLVVNSNDPADPEILVPLSLQVTGAPNLEIVEEVDFNEVFLGGIKELTVELSNNGTDVLEITGVTIDNAVFATDLVPQSLEVGQVASFTVSFQPLVVDTYFGQLTLISNDPGDPTLSVDLLGVGLEPPVVAVTPTSISEDLLTGESVVSSLAISNTGGSDLEVNINPIVTSPSMVGLSVRPQATVFDPNLMKRYNQDTTILSSASEMIPTIKKKSMVELLGDSAVIYYDDMETVGDWTHYAVVGSVDNWSLSSARSNSGSFSWNVAQHSGAGSDALESPAISLPFVQEVFMSFSHWYDFDDCDDITFDPDGLIVQISIDNGVSWSKIDPVDSYPYVLDDICDNPIAFEEAYAHSNGAFENATFDLTTYVGEDVKLRFLAGWDCGNCAMNEGWYMDDLVIYQPINWLEISSNFLVVPSGSTTAVDVILNATGLNGGTYEADLSLTTNDPVTPELTVPVTLDVTGAPDIELSVTALTFGDTFVGGAMGDSLEVLNIGTENLVISSVSNTNSDFTTSIGSMTLAPGASTYLHVDFEPSSAGVITDQVTIVSNDADEGTMMIDLTGTGLLPPVVSVDPTSMTSNLFTGEQDVQTLTIDNSLGGSDLEFNIGINYTLSTPSWVQQAGVIKTATSRTGVNEPGETVEVYGAEYSGDYLYFGITDYGEVMPYQFPVGNEHLASGIWVSGYTLAYEYGGTDHISYASHSNRLGIVPVSFTEQTNTAELLEVEVITQTSDGYIEVTRTFIFDKSEKYLTVLTDIKNISGGTLESVVFKSFADWDLDGSTSNNWDIDADRAMLYAYENTYQSIVSSPVADYVDIDGWDDYFIRATDEDLVGSVSSFDGLGLLHFELGDLSMGSSSSITTAFVSGNDLADLQNSADKGLNGANGWLTTDIDNGVVAAGSAITLDVTFDATGLNGGTYEADLSLTTNDPVTPELTVPVTLNVTGAPDIELSVTALTFGDTFVGGAMGDSLEVLNIGTENLVISSVSNANSDFTTSLGSMTLAPGASNYLHVDFEPSSAGVITDQVTIVSNDADEGTVMIDLTGTGLLPPVVSVDPTSMTSNLFTGEQDVQTLTIDNSLGGSDLEFNIGINYTLSTPSWVQQAGVIKTATSRTGVNEPGETVEVYGAEYSGDYLYFGITDYGEVMPYQFPVGNEHLALGSWVSGYTLAYEYGGTDHISYASHSSRLGIIPVSFTEQTNTAELLEVEVITQTSDGYIEVARTFIFDKSEKYLTVLTDIKNISGGTLESVVFKSFADWDLDGFTYNNWDIDADRAMLYAYENTYQSIVSTPVADYVDIDGWDDYFIRATDEDLVGSVSSFDGLGLLHFELGDLSMGSSSSITTAFVSGNDLADLQNSADKGLNRANGWLTTDIDNGVVSAGSAITLDVTFDATGLNGGTYEANLSVITNDPKTLESNVPITLNVTGAANINVTTDTIKFGDLFTGQTRTDSLQITNNGTDLLSITSISTSNSFVSVTPSTITLDQGEGTTLYVSYTPDVPEILDVDLEILSNDPDQSTLFIRLLATALEPPIAIVDKESIRESLIIGDSSMHSLSIKNTGGSDLIYSLAVNQAFKEAGSGRRGRKAIGHYADLSRISNGASLFAVGDTLDVSYSYTSNSTGMVLVGNELFVVSYESDQLIVYDYTSELELRRFDIHNEPYGITFDGQYFWIGNSVGNVFAYDLNGNNIGSFSCPFTYYPALTWDGEYFIVGRALSTGNPLYKIDVDGTIIESFNSPYSHLLNAIHYVASHDLYHGIDLNSYKKLVSFDLSNGIIQPVNSIDFNPFSNFAYSLAHDGNDLLILDWDGELVRLEDGIQELKWLEVSPNSGVVSPSSEIDLEVQVDAKDLEPGEYKGVITIQSNDPLNPDLEIEVLLNVCASAGGTISVDPIPDYDWLMDKGKLLIDMESVFDYSGTLEYAGFIDNPAVADMKVNGFIMSLEPIAIGNTTVVVKVFGSQCEKAEDSFEFRVSEITSLSLEEDSELKVYPNPAKTSFFILGLEGTTMGYIRDLSGRLIREVKVSDESPVDVQDLNSGSYFISIENAGRSQNIRFMIQR